MAGSKWNQDLKQKYYEDIVKIMPGHVYWKDKNGAFLGCNLQQALDAGLSSCDEIIGKTDYDMPWAMQAAYLQENDRKIMESEQAITMEEIFELPDGTIKYYLSQKQPLYDKENKVSGILGISFEITDRKNLEKALQASKEKEAYEKYLMTEFVSNMGHDFVTPVSDVGAVAEMFDMYAEEYPELTDLIKLLKVRSIDCGKVLGKLIDATSIANLEVQPERFSTVEELLILKKDVEPFLIEKNLKIIIHPLKPKKEDFITTDRPKCNAILKELITNAINFTDQGEINIYVLKENDRFIIKVVDTGIGIPSDKLEYIFEQYTKISPSNKHAQIFKGIGAGLYLARIRARILNAAISVESELGKGSTFTLSIPIIFTK